MVAASSTVLLLRIRIAESLFQNSRATERFRRMSEEIKIYKNRLNTLTIRLGYDISADTFESHIRSKQSATSDLLGTWDISFVTDGTDGELFLEFDEQGTITNKTGYTDLKRVSGGDDVYVFDPIKVIFVETVTP
jgi:hypothetical protein